MKEKVVWQGSTQLAPVPVVLVGCGNNTDIPYNLITVAWAGTVCSDPAMLGIAIRPERHSYGIIEKCGEFTVNLPSRRLAKTVDYCGVVSGRDVDKIKKCSLHVFPGKSVSAPVIEECPITLECKLQNTIPLGSHTLFLGVIEAIQLDPELIDPSGRMDIDRADLLAYAHGHYYGLGECIGHFGYSVRKKPGPVVRK
ncbi:MAG: flavin reductase family protein [Lentisphaeria bacterium]|nr:flavin reductase family protein [Lentisphaeria bacterium]